MSILFAAVGGQGGVVVPGAPGTLSLSAGSTPATEINLSWSAPSDTGGGTISGYRIKKDGSVLVADTSSTGTTYTATGLTRVTSYNFTVAAINEKGTGADGNTPSLTTSAEVPGAPGTLSLAAGTPSYSAINLSWSAPSDTGGATITGYRIKKDGSVLVADTGNTNTTYSATGLTGSTSYNFNVAAINSIGTGADGNTPSLTTGASPVGYFMGGYDNNGSGTYIPSDAVYKYSFAGDSWSTLGTSLATAVRDATGVSNDGTCGYGVGGYGSTRAKTIKKLTYSNDALSVNSTDIDLNGMMAMGSMSSSIKGYLAGGNMNYPQWNNDIKRLLYSNETVSTMTAAIGYDKQNIAGMSDISGGYGWTGGGYASSVNVYSDFDRMQFSNDSKELNHKAIATARYSLTGLSDDGTAGYIGGGTNAASSRVNIIDKFDFSSTTFSVSGSTLNTTIDSMQSVGIQESGNFGCWVGGFSSTGNQPLSYTNKISFTNDSVSSGGVVPTVNGYGHAVGGQFSNQGL